MSFENFHKQHTEPGLTSGCPLLPEKIGPYKIEALLNKGGMGWLYMGIHPETKQPIAVKVLPLEQVKNEEAVDLFLKESKITGLASHPNIVKLYGEGRWEGGLYLAMEWIQGVSLRQFLTQQSFSLKRSLDIILQVAYALEHLHSHGIIHRDLKPENILISEDGVIKVIDFGIAEIIKESPQRQSGLNQIVGTPNYMSPEQKKNPSTLTYASDIYSLGVIAYELILGKSSYGLIQTSLMPKKLGKIIGKALALSTSKRYQKIEDFIKDISDYLHSEEIEKEKPEQDKVTELLEIFQKAALSLSPFALPSYSFADIGVAKMKSPLKLGLYYDMFSFSNGTALLVIGDPIEPSLTSIFSSMTLRSLIRSLLTEENTPPLLFIEKLSNLIKKDPILAPFAFSYLFLDPLQNKCSFFNSCLSPLIYVPAGEEMQMLFNENTLLNKENPIPFSEHSFTWKTGDVLIYHSLSAKHRDSEGKEEQIQEGLKASLKNELFLSAQSQAEALIRDANKTPLFIKQKQTAVLFSIQRLS